MLNIRLKFVLPSAEHTRTICYRMLNRRKFFFLSMHGQIVIVNWACDEKKRWEFVFGLSTVKVTNLFSAYAAQTLQGFSNGEIQAPT